MNLQTQIPLNKQQHSHIDYHSKVVLFGSCFSENIGEKLEYFKFQNFQNPFGILFHPLAIESLITRAINEKEYSGDALFFHNEQWHCFDTHSKLSNASKEEMLNGLNTSIQSANKQIKNASHVVITLGTAWVYRYIETDTIVANCHKISQKKFLKELLSVDEIAESLQSIIALIRSVNSTTSILFTVSPVRHTKNGFVENTLSKSHLIAAIHQVIEPRNKSFYFPSYEIMMDELRDYRFYADDMIHPSRLAVDYIWEKFKDVWVSDEAIQTMEEVDAIQKGTLHKPFNPNSESHQKFLKTLEDKRVQLLSQFPHIVF